MARVAALLAAVVLSACAGNGGGAPSPLPTAPITNPPSAGPVPDPLAPTVDPSPT